jgi:hypothetical protein
MPNLEGHNGHDNGTRVLFFPVAFSATDHMEPAPAKLPDILQEFAIAKIPLQERCDILASKHNYRIK